MLTMTTGLGALGPATTMPDWGPGASPDKWPADAQALRIYWTGDIARYHNAVWPLLQYNARTADKRLMAVGVLAFVGAVLGLAALVRTST